MSAVKIRKYEKFLFWRIEGNRKGNLGINTQRYNGKKKEFSTLRFFINLDLLCGRKLFENKSLIPMQSTSCETLGWMKHKLESRLLGETSITSHIQMTPPLWQTVKKIYRGS